jgi:hypothetical protein
MAQSLKLELTLEFAMQVSGDDARVRELKAQSPKLRAQSSKAQRLKAQSSELSPPISKKRCFPIVYSMPPTAHAPLADWKAFVKQAPTSTH